MVWIDEVVEFSDSQIVCSVSLKSDAHYFSHEGIRPSSFIEFMAQGYAFGSIARNLFQSSTQKVSKAFLVGVTQAKFEEPSKLPRTGTLEVKLETERTMLPIILFKGMVFDENDRLLAEARLKVYTD